VKVTTIFGELNVDTSFSHCDLTLGPIEAMARLQTVVELLFLFPFGHRIFVNFSLLFFSVLFYAVNQMPAASPCVLMRL